MVGRYVGLAQRRVVRVLVDEAHSEAWSVRPDLAAAMRPEHPADASYVRAAALLADRDFTVAVHREGPLTGEVLAAADVLVVAHPSDPKWERTTGSGEPTFADDELAAVHGFVARGGGLVVLAETEQGKYGNNVDSLLAPFGLEVLHETVYDYERCHTTPSWVLGAVEGAPRLGFAPRAAEACFYRAGVVVASGPDAAVAARTSPSADPPGAGLLALASHGEGRVALFADSDLFGDDCIADFDHEQLWLDTCYWVARAAFARSGASATSPPPDFAALAEAVEALRALEAADGSIESPDAGRGTAGDRVEAVVDTLRALAPGFPHERPYLDAVVEDLERFAASGFRRPDFSASLAAFHPELDRRDGRRHLVLFPMYTPNASLDTAFEALVVEVPWPAWAAELERERFDNAKFVPLHLVAGTSGYASECAVLFPETVAAAPGAPNDFGGIFCDREAARLRRVVEAARPVLGLDLPPELDALLASGALLRDVYLLWDLVHDRAHAKGDLPFDPFMVRQRMPYWMYSLEELRCDLVASRETAELAAEGFAFARYVPFAVALDRLIRFPVTGSRVRNYDGLAGQVLFGFLHRAGVVRWTDNRLHVAWGDLVPAMDELREEVEACYREGIDRTRVGHWIAGHDLVARYVSPTLSSRWAADRRELADERDPRAWVGAVEDDEFPLSIFYRNLRARLVAAGAVAAEGAVP